MVEVRKMNSKGTVEAIGGLLSVAIILYVFIVYVFPALAAALAAMPK